MSTYDNRYLKPPTSDEIRNYQLLTKLHQQLVENEKLENKRRKDWHDQIKWILGIAALAFFSTAGYGLHRLDNIEDKIDSNRDRITRLEVEWSVNYLTHNEKSENAHSENQSDLEVEN